MEDKFIGKRLDSRYEIHQHIGSGGMSNVYKAYDKLEDRWVAVKILKDEFSNNTEFLRRFRNESKAIAMLSHPNIVKVYDVSFGDVVQYIVMEYISGITVKEYITRRNILPWQEAVYLTAQVLKALEHAHDKGIVHRDIKPQNIILLKDGFVKVTDFGIARVSQNATQTMSDKALGSVHYISPEQARGEYTTSKADLYSLGIMLYEMLTGTLPFDAENPVTVALMQVQETARNPRSINPDIPVGLEQIIMKAMEKNSVLRFESAADMLKVLDEFRQNPNINFNFNQNFADTKQVDISQMNENSSDATRVVTTVVPSSNKTIGNVNNQGKQKVSYSDNFEYEEELIKSKRTAKGSMVITGIVTALIVTILALGVYLVIDFIQQEPTVEENTNVVVPNFVGKVYQNEINGNVLYDSFVFRIQHIEDDSKQVGEVIRQSPNDGIAVKIGKEVTLQLAKASEEPEEVELIDVVGKSETEAYNTLLNKNYTVRVEYVNNEYVDSGYVINTNPEPNSWVTIEDEITIYVSSGPAVKPVAVPGIIGEDLDSAKAFIKGAGLVAGSVRYDEDSEEDANVVIECSPKPGTQVSKGSTVTIVVSKGTKLQKNVKVAFDMPKGVTNDVVMTIYLTGELYDTVTVNPSLLPTYSFTIAQKSGTEQVVIKLDGQFYVFGTAEFDSKKGSFAVDDYYPYKTPSGDLIFRD